MDCCAEYAWSSIACISSLWEISSSIISSGTLFFKNSINFPRSSDNLILLTIAVRNFALTSCDLTSPSWIILANADTSTKSNSALGIPACQIKPSISFSAYSNAGVWVDSSVSLSSTIASSSANKSSGNSNI